MSDTNEKGRPDANRTAESEGGNLVPESVTRGADAGGGIYREHARDYLASGLGMPIPLRGKVCVVKGATGGSGVTTAADVVTWEREHARLNIGLRLDMTVVGIDVDAYGEKRGMATLATFESTLGVLPPTVHSTSRGPDQPSSIRLYRITEADGLALVGELDLEHEGGVEVIHHGHRYVTAAPSLHPGTGAAYRWFDANDGPIDGVPSADELPDLPPRWVEHLVERSRAKTETRKADLSGQEAWDRLTQGPVHPRYQPLLDRVQTTGTDRKVMRAVTMALARLAVVERVPGGRAAYDQLLATWLAEPKPGWRLTAGGYRNEADALMLGAVRAVVPDAEIEFMTGKHVEKSAVKAADTPIEPATVALARYDAAARRWLGPTYDLEAGHAVLATAAVSQLDGDPVWLLVLSGSGNAKTEALSALVGAGATVISTIASEGALLSGTASKDKAKGATGGLLRQVGSSGIIAIKDVTSILSMNRDARAAVLAALREVYDGRWIRTLGVDGGRTLAWEGRLVVIGAVTSAWDKAHAVIATMGDRFVLVRPSSREGRLEAGRQALANTGHEEAMRTELADANAAVLAAVDASAVPEHTEDEAARLLAAADLVTRARTAVEFDYRGEPVSADEPEAPTRFAKQVLQMFRGGMAIGMQRPEAFALAMRCARDSMPPARLELLLDVAANPGTTTSEAQRRVQKPRATVDRTLQALHLLGLLRQEPPTTTLASGWTYRLAPGVDPSVLTITRNVITRGSRELKGSTSRQSDDVGETSISGDASAAASPATGIAA